MIRKKNQREIQKQKFGECESTGEKYQGAVSELFSVGNTELERENEGERERKICL